MRGSTCGTTQRETTSSLHHHVSPSAGASCGDAHCLLVLTAARFQLHYAAAYPTHVVVWHAPANIFALSALAAEGKDARTHTHSSAILETLALTSLWYRYCLILSPCQGHTRGTVCPKQAGPCAHVHCCCGHPADCVNSMLNRCMAPLVSPVAGGGRKPLHGLF